MPYIKSPMNYIGNKYRIINQIEPLFPVECYRMVDLFCGGCDVTINAEAQEKYANDINYHVIDIFEEMQKRGLDYVLGYIDATIDHWRLSKTNEDGYKRLREFYNKYHNPLDLYVLMCFSFNYQFRFNNAQEYNNPFGRNRSSFNDRMRNNLIKMIPRLHGVNFSEKKFQDFDYSILQGGDFLYADPPYLITTGSYNDGKRGFTGWGEKEERDLYDILDMLNKRGVRFALSNVSEHKGKKNDILIEWQEAQGYNLHNIDFNYKNSNYHGKNTNKPTNEILVTNY